MLIVKLEDEAEELNHFQKFQNVWKNWPVSKPKGGFSIQAASVGGLIRGSPAHGEGGSAREGG